MKTVGGQRPRYAVAGGGAKAEHLQICNQLLTKYRMVEVAQN